MSLDVLVVGAGLSGLHTAYELHKRNINFRLVEARERLGGRIASSAYSAKDSDTSHWFDMGPAWFWPGQRRLERLVMELGLQSCVFQQWDKGGGIYEDASGIIRKGIGGISMAGSYRLEGGMTTLINALEEKLPKKSVSVNASVSVIKQSENSLTSRLNINGEVTDLRSHRVVLALPPRLGVNLIKFQPILSKNRLTELGNIPTWMAGQAKFMAIYNRPFWRDNDLSGDAISHTGPLHEIHDATPRSEIVGALFGFVSVPAKQRHSDIESVKAQSLAQLTRLFGEEAKSPLKIILIDWSSDVWTATADDYVPSLSYDITGLADPFEPDWDGRLIWSGTETASNMRERNAGYLEGALEASETAIMTLVS